MGFNTKPEKPTRVYGKKNIELVSYNNCDESELITLLETLDLPTSYESIQGWIESYYSVVIGKAITLLPHNVYESPKIVFTPIGTSSKLRNMATAALLVLDNLDPKVVHSEGEVLTG